MQQLRVENVEKEDRIQRLESNIFNLDSFLRKIQDLHASLSERVVNLENICPIGDPNYALINNKCYYFELRPMNFQKAQENCKNKFQGNNFGQLYEAKPFFHAFYVHQEAKTHFGPIGFWIGIEESGNGTFVYSSDEENSQNFVEWNQNEPNTEHGHCVLMGVENNSKLNLRLCQNTFPSVCERVHVNQEEAKPLDYEFLEFENYEDHDEDYFSAEY